MQHVIPGCKPSPPTINRERLSFEKPIVLYGETETAKSAYARAHFDHPLVVRRRDDLKRIIHVTDGIIFDDCNFDGWTAEDLICLLDWDEPRSLPARYSDAQVNADIPLIFTTNKRPSKLFNLKHMQRKQKRATKRRFDAIEITAPLQQIGRPFNSQEKRARRQAGQNGPQGPSAD